VESNSFGRVLQLVSLTNQRKGGALEKGVVEIGGHALFALTDVKNYFGRVSEWRAWRFNSAATHPGVGGGTHTVVAPPSSVLKCLWEVFVRGFGVLFLSCACVSVSGVWFSVGVCVCVTC